MSASGSVAPLTGAILPRTDGVKLPPRFMLHGLRPLARWLVQRRYPVRVHGADQVPSSGAVILAANHIGVIDGPLLAIFSPRPVHALTKIEMFRGKLGRFLAWSGQVPLDRFHYDPAAIKSCVAILRAQRTVGIFPEGTRGAGDLELDRFHRGAAYLALVSGAPVVPVIFFGTRAPGAGGSSLPPRPGVVDMVYGTPFQVPAVAWPRTREQVEDTNALLQAHMSMCLARARVLTGRELPGPLPEGEHPDGDPDRAPGRGA
ncbi:lysophospholipid acyltransferase family protein [Nocardioides sp. Bht2]|uniref:lysophospholipid acyltransferase family protein n=1 Tax=Nocardioides sp. Bht2 TaxID=3392297 RepID=UPI0039B6A8E1